MIRYYFVNTVIEIPVDYGNAVGKLILCIVAHLMAQPEIGASIDRMLFVIEHPFNFRMVFVPILMSSLNVAVNFSTESLMMLGIVREGTIISTISNFSALFIISQLPRFYFAAISASDKTKAAMPSYIQAFRHLHKAASIQE